MHTLDMGHCNQENIFKQSSFSKDVWDIAVTVMDTYEESVIERQTLLVP